MVATGRIRRTNFYRNPIFAAVSERLKRVHLHGSSSGFDRGRHKSGYSIGLIGAASAGAAKPLNAAVRVTATRDE
jgi:hypothetical protein